MLTYNYDNTIELNDRMESILRSNVEPSTLFWQLLELLSLDDRNAYLSSMCEIFGLTSFMI